MMTLDEFREHVDIYSADLSRWPQDKVKTALQMVRENTAAKEYFDVGLFERAGVRVRWMEYAGYPEYPQLHGPFEHAVTALDLLFMTGPAAGSYLERQRHAA